MLENLNLKKIRVLVLEDNPAEAEINIRELRRAGFDPEWLCVETESDFLAALSPPPDLILSDYSMPQFDGMRAVALLRERKLDTPFILISGTMGEEVAVKSIKEGADDFLLKDRLARLGPAVVSALQNKRLRDERRLADERTHQSAQQQIAILNALPVHIALLDPQGVIITVNEAWRRFASANVLLGTDFTVGQDYIDVCERAHGECSEEAREASLGIRKVLSGESKHFSIEYPCHSPTEKRWFRLMVTPLSETQGTGAVVMHVNVTERREAEEALKVREREQRLLAEELTVETRRLQESQEVAHVGSWETDLDTLEVTWTDETHHIFETDPDTFKPTHQGFLEFVHPDDRAPVHDAFKRSWGKHDPFSIEHRIVLARGNVKVVEERWATICDSSGKPARAVGTCQDITVRKLGETALGKAMRMMSHVLNNIPAFVFWKDREYRYLGCNKLFSDSAGLDSPSEIIGKSDFELPWRESAESYRDDDRKVMEAAGQKLNFEESQVRPDGTILYLNTSKVPLMDEAGNVFGVLGIYIDITERKLAEVRIHYLNRIYAVLSDINQNIVREKDPEKMLAEACRIAVEKGRFLMAWIGLHDPGASTMRLAAHAGAAGDYLEKLKSALATDIAMHRPTSEAIGSGMHVSVNDIAHDPRKISWRDSALPLGFRASAAFPIKVDGVTIGTFNLYAREASFFTEEELHLLDELALNIGFALEVHQKAEALKQKENEYHDLIENLPVGVVVHAPDTSILLSNSMASKLLGLTAENMSGKTAADTAWQFLNEDGSKMPLVEYPVNRVLSSGEAIRRQNLGIRLPDVAEVTWVLCDAHPVRDARGAMLHIVVTIIDVTERRKAESEYLQAEKRYRRLFEAAKDGILILDAETGMIDDVNPFLIELLGFPKEQFLRKSLWELGFFKNLVANHVKFEELKRNEYVRYDNLPLETVDGRQIDVEFISNVYYVNSKKVMQCNIRDITERKRVEAAHIRLATAVEQASEAIVITDVQGNIVYTNPAFEKITGYTRAEALDKNPRILKSGKHDIAFYREMWATIKRGEAWHGRMINKRKDGSQFEEDATISPVRDASGKVVNYVAVKRDVTREVQLEAQFRQSQKMEAFGLLAGGVAHDFNNLMSVVMGYSDIWLMKLPLDAPIRGPLKAIRTAGERAADLTKQLLAFSRQTILEPKILDLNTVVREMEKMLKRLIGEDIHFTSILNPAIPRIRIDPGQLGQVFMNLCVNARDAMPRGGSLTIETRTTDFDETYVNEHPGAKHGRQVVLAVSDTGTGMPPEIVARIFEPFFTTKEVGKGTGLGLAVVYGVVTQSGGFIQVGSKVDVGTTFTLYFPATLDEVQAAGGSEQILEYSGIETILVVEDEESLCEIAAETLKSFGYKVLKAHSGPDALKLVSAHGGTIDLILTDVVMPKMSGRELAESLKQKLPALKVIFMSGYTDDSVVRHGVHHEKVPFLQKPFAPFDLLKKVREELDKR